MKEKLEQTLSREGLAEYLEGLAGQLRAGRLTVGSTQWAIPDTLEFKVRQKEEKGRFRQKLEWRCSTLESYEPGAVEAVTRWRSNMKDVKKAMARAFKEVKRTVGAGGLPDEALLTELEHQTRSFHDLAEPEWRGATEEFMSHLENLRAACKVGSDEIIHHELQDLETRMVSCHRDFK